MTSTVNRRYTIREPFDYTYDTVDPTVNDDVTRGFRIGSRWINTASDEEFVCFDATTGAAVWTSTTGGSGSGDDLETIAVDIDGTGELVFDLVNGTVVHG